MALTYDEARKKWCPFGPTHHVPRHAFDGGPATDRNLLEVDAPKSMSHCIGHACMAWRWDAEVGMNKPTRVHPSVLVDHWKGWTVTDATPDERGYVEISPPPAKSPTGFCGLAGRPE